MAFLRLAPGGGATHAPGSFDGDRSREHRGPDLRYRRPHEAELLLEQVQRRLDNLRAALGGSIGGADEGPRAA